MTTPIRPVTAADLPALRAVIDANALFPSEMLADMIAPWLGANTADLWFTTGDPAIAVAYAAPERMTNGTWNQLLIAVHPDHHDRGIGRALMRHLESTLAAQGERMVIVETSGLPAFERTRGFYARIGYEEQGRVRDFYDAGEDKVIFRRMLGASE